jgi:hypothetical protein
LFVADEDVAPREKVEELAIAPEVAPVLALGLAGADDEEGFGTQAFEQEETELTEGRETLLSRIFTNRKGGFLTTETQRV